MEDNPFYPNLPRLSRLLAGSEGEEKKKEFLKSSLRFMCNTNSSELARLMSGEITFENRVPKSKEVMAFRLSFPD